MSVGFTKKIHLHFDFLIHLLYSYTFGNVIYDCIFIFFFKTILEDTIEK